MLCTRNPGDDMGQKQYNDWDFYCGVNTRIELGDSGKPNPDLGSIFFNEAVRKTVIKNFVDLNINADTAIAIMDIRGHAVEPLVRSEFHGKSGKWETSAVLARWIDTQIIIGSYHHSPHWVSRCIRAMALRGDETYPEDLEARKRCDELLGLRMAYEVNVALTMLLRMEEFLTQARAIAEVCAGLLLPARPSGEGKFLHLIRDAFASQLKLPEYEAPRQFYQEFLYSLAHPTEDRETEKKKLSIWCFHKEIERRFRPWISGDWPNGSDTRIRELLLAHPWKGQEALEIRYMCHEFGLGYGRRTKRTKEQMDEDLLIMRAVGHDMAARRASFAVIKAWLVETHPELADLVRPLKYPS